jgi:hypothetical protein
MINDFNWHEFQAKKSDQGIPEVFQTTLVFKLDNFDIRLDG